MTFPKCMNRVCIGSGFWKGMYIVPEKKKTVLILRAHLDSTFDSYSFSIVPMVYSGDCGMFGDEYVVPTLNENTGDVYFGWCYEKDSNHSLDFDIAESICFFFNEDESVSESDKKQCADFFKKVQDVYEKHNLNIVKHVIAEYPNFFDDEFELYIMEIAPVGEHSKSPAVVCVGENGAVYPYFVIAVGGGWIELESPIDEERSHKYPTEILRKWFLSGKATCMDWMQM